MRTEAKPLARHLLMIAVASAVPSAWVAAALTAALCDGGWSSALMLMLGVLALLAGMTVSFVTSNDLKRMLQDLARDANMLARGLPLARNQPIAREADAIAQALNAAAAQLKKAERAGKHPEHGGGTWRWDLVAGTVAWDAATQRILGVDMAALPSLGQLMAVIRSGDRAPMAAWLAALARDNTMDPWSFRLANGDGPPIIASALCERDSSGMLIAISGGFVAERASANPRRTRVFAAAPMVASAAARLRERANVAGLEVRIDEGIVASAIEADIAVIEPVFAQLIERAVVASPRGATVVFQATERTDTLDVTLSWSAPKIAGMGLAGMAEPQCGLEAAQIEKTHAAVEACGGKLTLAGDGNGETVRISLPLVRTLERAAA